MKEQDLTEEWDEYLKETDKDAVQKQETEEVPLQEKAKNSEEVVEASKEEIKD